MKKILSVMFLISILFLTGCNSVNQQQKEMPEDIKSDAIISFVDYSGGECIESYSYYICYDDCKVIEHELFTYVPLTYVGSDEKSSEESYVREYDISSKLMERIKQFVSKVEDENLLESTNANNYELKIGEKIYYTEDSETFLQLLKEIKK